MGFELPHPLVPGASPLVDNLDTVRRLEDAGAPMIVMHSLFEEQIVARGDGNRPRAIETPKESFAEALSYFPEPDEFALGPDEYLEQIRRIKAAVAVPVIGSLNGTTEGGWLRYARLIEQAGADGLELNLYELATDPDETGAGGRAPRRCRWCGPSRSRCTIPVAVKLSPFYSSIANFAQPAATRRGRTPWCCSTASTSPTSTWSSRSLLRVNLSSPAELLLRLRWIGRCCPDRIRPSLAATGGRAHGRGRGQGGDGGRRTRRRWSRPCCGTGRITCGRSARSWRSGWRSTSTSRCGRCRAA